MADLVCTILPTLTCLLISLRPRISHSNAQGSGPDNDFFGMNTCYGTFNKYMLPVNHSSIDATSSIPAKAVQGETVVATVDLTNNWKPLEADLTVELCVNDRFCEELTKEDVQVNQRTTTVTFPYTPDTTGDLSITVSGPIGLDLDHYRGDGVAVDCDRDGKRDDPTQGEMITVGTVQNSGVTQVKTASAAIFDNDLLVRTLQLEWATLQARVAHLL